MWSCRCEFSSLRVYIFIMMEEARVIVDFDTFYSDMIVLNIINIVITKWINSFFFKHPICMWKVEVKSQMNDPIELNVCWVQSYHHHVSGTLYWKLSLIFLNKHHINWVKQWHNNRFVDKYYLYQFFVFKWCIVLHCFIQLTYSSTLLTNSH